MPAVATFRRDRASGKREQLGQVEDREAEHCHDTASVTGLVMASVATVLLLAVPVLSCRRSRLGRAAGSGLGGSLLLPRPTIRGATRRAQPIGGRLAEGLPAT